MKRSGFLHAFGTCFAIVCIAGITAAPGQDARLQDRRVTIDMKEQPLGNVFRYLMETYDIPIGFEESILDRDHYDYSFQTNLPSKARKRVVDKDLEYEIEFEREFIATDHLITVSLRDGLLGDALDQIVGQMENYKWAVYDDVVNIFPIRGRDPRFLELLETRIGRFSLASGSTVDDISVGILKLKEFGGWLRRNKLHFTTARTGSSVLLDAQYGRKLERGLDFADLSFRELLNRITKSKKGGWILKWKRTAADGTEHIDIDI